MLVTAQVKGVCSMHCSLPQVWTKQDGCGLGMRLRRTRLAGVELLQVMKNELG